MRPFQRKTLKTCRDGSTWGDGAVENINYEWGDTCHVVEHESECADGSESSWWEVRLDQDSIEELVIMCPFQRKALKTYPGGNTWGDGVVENINDEWGDTCHVVEHESDRAGDSESNWRDVRLDQDVQGKRVVECVGFELFWSLLRGVGQVRSADGLSGNEKYTWYAQLYYRYLLRVYIQLTTHCLSYFLETRIQSHHSSSSWIGQIKILSVEENHFYLYWAEKRR